MNGWDQAYNDHRLMYLRLLFSADSCLLTAAPGGPARFLRHPSSKSARLFRLAHRLCEPRERQPFS